MSELAAPGVAGAAGTGGPEWREPDAAQRGLYERARAAAARAYAPYSGFEVGAVVVGPRGTPYSGVNVENASYPAGMCAERVALGALVAAGERRVVAVAVATSDDDDVAPCGLCLQALAELGDPAVVCRIAGEIRVAALRGLLTAPFDTAGGREPGSGEGS
jgi:cytidine deaminase